ncbi:MULTISPECIES: DUF1471 domain-containing protein [Tatumella]|uniref:DUF1471 domain-containing protein n=1 Tax=Tatumella punctata TaxID=399969 RepID=A0ABW1VMQ2_9GAMM|nr:MULTISPECIES: DUF1471 domain-containing protein [unclassified Tatumella]MBS0855684.1 DUF1471 domain-containing protein [Tatumella sp. JGM16]MBS0876665.1 DUF1471 domain-containing protein [Tatumella sp. JGM82]MBS0889948.1 DUF1471 domain-containing protein [Tatumella sp. JGM94]MBS0893190.1 DUF1471 domain-containing protein [Tatumella sp. JGM130]MBS0901192.1 DUF1471 domain-containing protein [Tatumella sp. JGM100]
MKMTKYTVSVLMAGILSFSAVAAEEVTQAQADSQQLVSLGTVSTTAETTSPMDAKKELSRLADEKGGKYFKVIAGREHGRISAVAEVYK